MCGEKFIGVDITPADTGSPPRVRGKDITLYYFRQVKRITPACAGKSCSVRRQEPSEVDHPRVCGEKVSVSAVYVVSAGSPPRVRGKVDFWRWDFLHQRITPACAGKSTIKACNTALSKDHPRVCGEKFNVSAGVMTTPGSPPRVRGKGMIAHGSALSTRITPACAGKSRDQRRPTARVEDHPRVCGEKLRRLPDTFSPAGSPPRVRGKDFGVFAACVNHGITPACAGKRAGTLIISGIVWDHPRVCGEKSPARQSAVIRPGSPPRVRGKGPCPCVALTRARITPACAGKSTLLLLLFLLFRDHPRVCGEKSVYWPYSRSYRGSPPRVRGKGHDVSPLSIHLRITPACAGKRARTVSAAIQMWDHPRVCGEKRIGSNAGASVYGSPPRVRGKD